MAVSEIECRCCGSTSLIFKGGLPDTSRFAGVRHIGRIPQSGLWLCQDCVSMQRYPVQKQAFYSEMYSKTEAKPWLGNSSRNDHRIVRSLVTDYRTSGRIVDIGSGDGAFLRSLPKSFQKFAVEPSPSAGVLLSNADISIVAADVVDVPTDETFDVVTAIDVIEHIVDTEPFFSALARMIRTSGLLIVSTGDPTTPKWRDIHQSRFWYSSYQEHLTFPSCSALEALGIKHGLVLKEVRRIRYRDLSMSRALLGLALQGSYSYAQFLHKAALAMAKRFKYGRAWPDYVHLDCAGIYTDHQVLAFIKA